MTTRYRGLILDVLLVVVVFAAYASSIRTGTTVWDDELLTTRNPYLDFSTDNVWQLLTNDLWIASAKGEPSGYWRPLGSLTLAINRWVLGNDPSAYHAGNVLIHALCVVVLHRLLRDLMSAKHTITPLVLAFSFAVAPVCSEAVCWLAGRFDLLATLFLLLALREHAKGRRVTTVIVVILALASKETGIIAPLLLFVYDLTRPRRSRVSLLVRPRTWIYYGAFVLVVAGYLLARRFIHVSGAPISQALVSGIALRGYLWCVALVAGTSIRAIPPSIFHVFRDPGWQLALIGAGVLVIVGTVIFFMRRRAPLALFGFGATLVALVPVGLTSPRLIQIGDRYAYFAFALMLLCAAGILARIGERFRAVSTVVVMLGAVWALAGIPALERRIAEWSNEDSFYASELARDRGRYWAALQLGDRRAAQGRYAEAEQLLLSAGSLAESYRIYVALCYVYLNQQRYGEAIVSCTRGLAINPSDPRAYVNRAHAELGLKDAALAMRDADAAIALKPHYAEGHYVRALAFLMLNKRRNAAIEAENVLTLNPSHARARELLKRLNESN